MNTSIKWIATLSLCVSALGLTAFAPQTEKPETGTKAKAKVGEAAPAFTLEDLNGKKHSLADYKGKVVVLEWTNPSCPLIQKAYSADVTQDTVAKMKEMGSDYVYLAVNSTAQGVTREQVIEQNKKFLKEHEISSLPVLIDHDGTVGHAYDARTTPHMYVIDREGVLRYHGAYTDDPGSTKDDYSNHVLTALQQIKAGETVSPDWIKPWGCSVKYAKKGS